MCTPTIHIEKKTFVFDNLEYIKECKVMERIIHKLKNKLDEAK